MQSVSSNAVALALTYGIKRIFTELRPPVSGSGASNIDWLCIETNDGTKICSGRATATRSASPTGNMYYSGGADEQWYYPSGFFTDTPMCQMEVSAEGMWMITATQNATTDKIKTKKVCPSCAVDFGTRTVYYDILAIGK